MNGIHRLTLWPAFDRATIRLGQETGRSYWRNERASARFPYQPPISKRRKQ